MKGNYIFTGHQVLGAKCLRKKLNFSGDQMVTYSVNKYLLKIVIVLQ